MNIYRKLAEGGGYNLPYLARLFSPDGNANIYLINDNKNMTYKGKVYSASNFTYSPQNDGSAAFNVEIVKSDKIIDLLENSKEFFGVEIIGVFNGDTVEEIGSFKHKYGEASWSGKSLEIKLNKDDRGDMTFPALLFNSYNNRGNS